MQDNDLAGRMRVAIATRGVTQKEIAARMGTQESTLSRYMRGKQVPGGDALAEFVKAVGVNGHWLLTGEGPMEPPGVGSTAADQAAIEAVQEAMDDAIRRIRERGAH